MLPLCSRISHQLRVIYIFSGVDSVRSLGHTLSSMPKFEDVTPEEIRSKPKRFSPPSNAASASASLDVDGEDIEEIGGAVGGLGGRLGTEAAATAAAAAAFPSNSESSEAPWLNFDAEDVEEQFLLSADLEKTKKERKLRKDPP